MNKFCKACWWMTGAGWSNKLWVALGDNFSLSLGSCFFWRVGCCCLNWLPGHLWVFLFLGFSVIGWVFAGWWFRLRGWCSGQISLSFSSLICLPSGRMLHLFSLPRFWCLDVSRMVSHLYTGSTSCCKGFWPSYQTGVPLFFQNGFSSLCSSVLVTGLSLISETSIGGRLIFRCVCIYVLPWFLQSVWPHRLICGQRCLLYVGAFEVANDAALNAATLCEIWWHFQTLGSVSIWFILLRYGWCLVVAFSL